MKTIDKILLDSITLQAKETTRLRKNFNFHTSYSEPINRMLNAMEPGTYIQPVSYTHLRAHETVLDIVCRLLLEKKKYNIIQSATPQALTKYNIDTSHK